MSKTYVTRRKLLETDQDANDEVTSIISVHYNYGEARIGKYYEMAFFWASLLLFLSILGFSLTAFIELLPGVDFLYEGLFKFWISYMVVNVVLLFITVVLSVVYVYDMKDAVPQFFSDIKLFIFTCSAILVAGFMALTAFRYRFAALDHLCDSAGICDAIATREFDVAVTIIAFSAWPLIFAYRTYLLAVCNPQRNYAKLNAAQTTQLLTQLASDQVGIVRAD